MFEFSVRWDNWELGKFLSDMELDAGVSELQLFAEGEYFTAEYDPNDKDKYVAGVRNFSAIELRVGGSCRKRLTVAEMREYLKRAEIPDSSPVTLGLRGSHQEHHIREVSGGAEFLPHNGSFPYTFWVWTE